MAQIAVVRGGRSLERDISLRSGHHVAATLRHLGHEVSEIDVDAELTRSIESADLVFIALHGRDGEDGTIQLACEALGVAYTGSGPLTCRFAFDKGLAKGMLNAAGLPTPPGYVLSREGVQHMGAGVALRRAADRLGYPLVVKPTAQGSALGLAVVDGPGELQSAALGAFDHGDRVLLERFIDGADVSIALYGRDLATLPAVEIQSRAKVFDFETRLSPGAFEFVCPPSTSGEQVNADIEKIAKQAATLLHVRDFGRVDLRVDADGPMVLDVKTCPGLTESSILPYAAAQAKLSFQAVVADIVSNALTRAPVARR
jgi:D-alanine-D-alanine ligase